MCRGWQVERMLFAVQVYASTSGEEYSRDNEYHGAKPGSVYPGSFYMQGNVA